MGAATASKSPSVGELRVSPPAESVRAGLISPNRVPDQIGRPPGAQLPSEVEALGPIELIPFSVFCRLSSAFFPPLVRALSWRCEVIVPLLCQLSSWRALLLQLADGLLGCRNIPLLLQLPIP